MAGEWNFPDVETGAGHLVVVAVVVVVVVVVLGPAGN